jgi:hydroxyethylthiazole kinase-like sugar kinase family protein
MRQTRNCGACLLCCLQGVLVNIETLALQRRTLMNTIAHQSKQADAPVLKTGMRPRHCKLRTAAMRDMMQDVELQRRCAALLMYNAHAGDQGAQSFV